MSGAPTKSRRSLIVAGWERLGEIDSLSPPQTSEHHERCQQHEHFGEQSADHLAGASG